MGKNTTLYTKYIFLFHLFIFFKYIFTNKTFKKAGFTTRSTTVKPIGPKSCSLFDVQNKKQLNKNNLVLLDIHCTKSSSESQRCISKQSFVKYTCEKGFVFENLRDEFDSLCQENGQWETIPRCIRSKYLLLIYKKKFY